MKTATITPRFHVTYDIVTPESAEHGDFAENGFLDSSGWQHSVAGIWGEAAAKLGNECAMSLREAVALCSPQEDSGRWFSEVDGETDYSTGENLRKSLHPPRDISPASYARLRKLFKI